MVLAAEGNQGGRDMSTWGGGGSLHSSGQFVGFWDWFGLGWRGESCFGLGFVCRGRIRGEEWHAGWLFRGGMVSLIFIWCDFICGVWGESSRLVILYCIFCYGSHVGESFVFGFGSEFRDKLNRGGSLKSWVYLLQFMVQISLLTSSYSLLLFFHLNEKVLLSSESCKYNLGSKAWPLTTFPNFTLHTYNKYFRVTN